MQNMLINYIRNHKKEPCGVVVAVRKNDEVFYGYSLCNPIDKWDKKQGVKIAVARAFAQEYLFPSGKKNQKLVEDSFYHLSKRASRYYKDISPDNVKFIIND